MISERRRKFLFLQTVDRNIFDPELAVTGRCETYRGIFHIRRHTGVDQGDILPIIGKFDLFAVVVIKTERFAFPPETGLDAAFTFNLEGKFYKVVPGVSEKRLQLKVRIDVILRLAEDMQNFFAVNFDDFRFDIGPFFCIRTESFADFLKTSSKVSRTQ